MMHYQMGLHDALSRYRWFSVLFEKQGKSQAKKEKKDNIGAGAQGKHMVQDKARYDTHQQEIRHSV